MKSIKAKAKEFLSRLIRNVETLNIFEQMNAIIQYKINSVSSYYVAAMLKAVPII